MASRKEMRYVVGRITESIKCYKESLSAVKKSIRSGEVEQCGANGPELIKALKELIASQRKERNRLLRILNTKA